MATNGLLSGGETLFGGSPKTREGILNWTPVIPSTTALDAKGGSTGIPMEAAMHQGSNPYENYVRAWPNLLDHYMNKMPSDPRSMADWGRAHWLEHGQYNPARTAMSPHTLPASRHLPARVGLEDYPELNFPGEAARPGTGYDPREGVTKTTFTGSLPQIDVEGYKYVYPIYTWNKNNQNYEYVGSNTEDRGEYPYYPYMPYGGEALRSRNDRILIGHRMVPE